MTYLLTIMGLVLKVCALKRIYDRNLVTQTCFPPIILGISLPATPFHYFIDNLMDRQNWHGWDFYLGLGSGGKDDLLHSWGYLEPLP